MKRLLRLLMGVALVASGAACQDTGDISTEKPAPRLISIVPSTVWNGCTAIISGTGFSTVAEENIVTIDGQTVAVTSATANRLTLTMPEHADGKAKVAVTVNGKAADVELETVYAELPELEAQVTGIAPVKGYAGDVVTISGENFSEVASENLVTFGASPAVVQSATRNTLKVVAPEHAKGAVDVTIISGGKTMKAPSQFTYMVFSITSNAPKEGGAGDEVTLRGEGFSEVAEENVVLVNGQQALVKSATETAIVVQMPDNPAGKYDFSLTVGDKTITGGEFSYKATWRIQTVVGSVTSSAAFHVYGTGTSARLRSPQAITKAPDGSYWITTRFNPDGFGVVKMTQDYVVSKIVMKADDADLTGSHPWGCDFDNNGNFYFAAKALGNVMTCSASGAVSGVSLKTSDGSSELKVSNAMEVKFDAANNMYVLYRTKLVKLTEGIVVKEWALTGTYNDTFCFSSDYKTLFVFNEKGIFSIDLTAADPAVVQIAGSGTTHTTAATYTDGQPGQPLTASFNTAEGSIYMPDGSLMFCDTGAKTVRLFTPGAGKDYTTGTVTTILGNPWPSGIGASSQASGKDGAGASGLLMYPGGMTFAPDGETVLMVDGLANGTVRKIFYK